MKYIKTYSLLLALMIVSLSGCKKFLDRPPLTELDDETAWTTEDNLRLYANKFYPAFFVGYGTGFNTNGAMLAYQFSDDVFLLGTQGNFARAVPNSEIWGMGTLRSINIMIDRMNTKMTGLISNAAFNHWMGIARFFRAMEYAELVTRFGDVPLYDRVLLDNELEEMYKPRTPRNEVMDAVFDDLKFALEHVRTSDGDQTVNKYVVAGFASRVALYEGTWQKYYYKNTEQAKKFLTLAIEAADIVKTSGKFDIVTDFRTLFSSNSLAGNKDVILYRHYDAAVGVQHSVASYNNLSESLAFGPSTDLIKSFICVDGNAWQNSAEANAKDFTLSKMIATRDSRLEASFFYKPHPKNRASYWYITKFSPRWVNDTVAAGKSVPPEFSSSRNETDYPVFRYAEALINWIEAKEELAGLGGAAVNQSDLDASINKIRNRVLAPEAIARGVKKTAPLKLDAMPNDPTRDLRISNLLWEIRRERRMEFAFEHSRFEDLKRWSKLDYMDVDTKPDLLSGGWVNFSTELPDELIADKVGKISVVTMAGTVVVYNGTNGPAMKGFYRDVVTKGRQPYLNQNGVNPYLSPVGKNQMDDYASKGFVLTQTEGWPQN